MSDKDSIGNLTFIKEKSITVLEGLNDVLFHFSGVRPFLLNFSKSMKIH